MTYTLNTDKKNLFASIYLLEYMVNKSSGIEKDSLDNINLKPILNWMEIKGLTRVNSENKCVQTEKGRDLLISFMDRYTDFLQVFDVYCAVDLEEGEFAFEAYFDMEQNEWDTYIQEERWEDLRIAVAVEKKIDPIEIVFMSFLNEGRIGKDENGEWKTDLLIGKVWDEILDICNSAITKEQLVYDDVSGESVVQDILKQGTELMVELHKKEEETEQACIPQYSDADDPGFGEVVTEEVVEEEIIGCEHFGYDYYDPYFDPFYISPVWVCDPYDFYW